MRRTIWVCSVVVQVTYAALYRKSGVVTALRGSAAVLAVSSEAGEQLAVVIALRVS
jgi:hypothetical protein